MTKQEEKRKLLTFIYHWAELKPEMIIENGRLETGDNRGTK
ncbi:hypothetical protein LCGC14_0831600 [marine sediment metagenome]|uniref:Uncharacterized protein n=1 Tax=marine sediment metagenome TaxID=412755 RepID=A0A0F9S0G8_9ZZZZ